MAEIPVQVLGQVGKVVSMVQAAAGDTAQTGSNKKLVVHNGDASSHTVTVQVPGTDFTGAARPDLATAIAAGGIAVIPLLDLYADPANNNQAVVTYDATPATLKRAVVAD